MASVEVAIPDRAMIRSYVIDLTGEARHALAQIDEMLGDWERRAVSPEQLHSLALARAARADIVGKSDAYYRLRRGMGSAELLAEAAGADPRKCQTLAHLHWLTHRIVWYEALTPDQRKRETLAQTNKDWELVALLRAGALTD